MLFKTAQELKKYLPANAAFEFHQAEQFILQAEQQYILPVLGNTTFNILNQAYAFNNLTTDQEKLLDKVRYPLANYTYLQYIPFAQVVISASGIHIEVNDQKKTAFEWQINQLRQQLAEAADNGIESLYLFLESNKTTFTDWAASPERSILKECFINTAVEFNQYYNINSSRRMFRLIKGIMMQAEDNVLSVICQPLFNAIKTEILSGIISSDNLALLKFIRPAVAYHTIARALIQLDVKLTPDGVQAFSTSDRIAQDVRTPAELQRIANLSHQLTADAEAKLQQLREFLHQNISTYPLYQSSPCYTPPASMPVKDSNSPFFIV